MNLLNEFNLCNNSINKCVCKYTTWIDSLFLYQDDILDFSFRFTAAFSVAMFQYLPLTIIISLNVMIYATLKRQATSGPGWSIFTFFGI